MSDLIELHEHQDGNEVHEGCIELEGDVGGADMVAAGHDALHEESQTHGIVQRILCGHSKLLFANIGVLGQEALVAKLFDQDDSHEEEAEGTISEVAEDMVKVSDQSKRFSAKVVVVANVLIARESLLP